MGDLSKGILLFMVQNDKAYDSELTVARLLDQVLCLLPCEQGEHIRGFTHQCSLMTLWLEFEVEDRPSTPFPSFCP